MANNARDAAAEEEKRLKLIPIFTLRVNKFTYKGKGVD